MADDSYLLCSMGFRAQVGFRLVVKSQARGSLRMAYSLDIQSEGKSNVDLL